mgnify:CR=1 FL=1|jgi:hypothetical protein
MICCILRSQISIFLNKPGVKKRKKTREIQCLFTVFPVAIARNDSIAFRWEPFLVKANIKSLFSQAVKVH